ncbi:FBD-associated F-box protein At4g10400 [Eutrema salsugineum]|uniref:FBD-associated F-box protein At4g10400 n=1 Tax=Eutrema salsugineum TaxID=72664 RepID=UPI000CED3795|nr:FBD-associated F-box protein At4g10400 [Eutrema salsugineum]
MGRISELPNDLLIKILSFLPTKVAVSTSILSKQWEFLWMWLPKLVYTSSCCYSKSEDKRLKCFLDRNLPLHKTPVIESLRLYFRYPHLEPGDIKLWVLTVVSRYVLELEISYFTYQNEQDILSSSLYTCKSLVTLKLNGMILVDVPRMVCLPCLKTLRLECDDHLDEIVVKTPSLKYLDFTYYSFKIHHCLIENMPKLSEAYVNVSFPILERLIGSITSVKRLTLLQVDYGSEDVYGGGFVFNQLVHLNLRMYQRYSLNVQVRLLKDSPKLRLLGLDLCRSRRDVHGTNGVIFWNQQSTVPELLSSGAV